MSKFHICGVTKSGSEEDLKELLEPLFSYYDALNWGFHLPEDGGYNYLESMKKEGKIQLLDWKFRLDFSRNHYLYNGTIKPGDYFCALDSQERLYPAFFEKWPQLKQLLEYNNIDGVVLYGKRFLYKYNDFMEYRGNPHEGLLGANKTIELTSIDGFQETSWFWGSVRAQKRDKTESFFHHVNYYVNFPNSNNCLLGLDRYANREEIFHKREVIRKQFRAYCQSLDLLPLTIDKFKDLCNNRLEEMKYFINSEKYLNTAYACYILGITDLGDAHDLEKMVKI